MSHNLKELPEKHREVYDFMQRQGRNGVKKILRQFAVHDVVQMANGVEIIKTGKKSWDFFLRNGE